jgi:pyridoxine kinase
MAKVLSISSQVVYGHVGNSAAGFVFQRMGHEFLGVSTVLLSNRPGYHAIAGKRISPSDLNELLSAANSNGWLNGTRAILTGYIPTPEHAMLCERWVATVKTANADAIYLCDPIIGDEPGGIYIDEAAAAAIRDRLSPLADIVTPNRFELSYLSGRSVSNPEEAVAAASSLGRPVCVVTSAPAGAPERIANILVEGRNPAATVSLRAPVEARGTGDFFAAIFLARKLAGFDNTAALQAASAAMDNVLAASAGREELALLDTQSLWAAKKPPLAPLARLPGIGRFP